MLLANVPGTRINELDAKSIESHSSYFNKQQQLRGGGWYRLDYKISLFHD